MGIYISALNCKQLYDIDINCEIQVKGNETYNSTIIGGYVRGQIPADPDIAGIGVVASFIGTTVFAIALSAITLLSLIINRRYLHNLNKLTENFRLADRLGKWHISELCEELVIGVSDTQVFTGGAYAIALRYFKGCTTTAYHYDVVVMMMLMTCTTHMLSVTIVRNYWRWGFLSGARVIVCTGVFIVTGILLANQNNGYTDERQFPAQVPPHDANYSSILLPAACFQQGNSQLLNTLHDSVGEHASDAFLRSQPGNSIPGWNCYLTTLLFYILAGFVDMLRAFRRGAQSKPNGRRARIVTWLNLSTVAQRQTRQQQRPLGRLNAKRRKSQTLQQQQQQQTTNGKRRFSPGTILFWLFCTYILSGICVAIWTIWVAGHQIGELRMWVKLKGWLVHNGNSQSAEDDSTSFGQLVPIFLNLMLLFILIHVVNGFCGGRSRKNHKYDIYGGIIHDTPPSSSAPAPQEVTENLNVGYKPEGGISMANMTPTQNNVNNGHGQWGSFSTAAGGQPVPVSPGPGIMTTTPTTAQIHQFPSNASPAPNKNNRHSSVGSVPTSPLAGNGGGFFNTGNQQQQQQQAQQRSMSMASTHVGSTSPVPQGGPYFQPGSSSPIMFQQPQYATYTAHSPTPPPQGQAGTQHQQGQGPVYYQVVQ
ncbi:hypothetical protein V8F20_010861 [Naviculisporaceae sp. PSN 640]